ncbi:FtsX-like permease family protein [Conexibacter woesei]|uniref:FtsX-like permease family protein n=1 Tax=Conexibacter woesei TaxID=191495 RepID=UPI00040EE4D7|nr:ABC transporter permease [Conexibacter woesei]
MSGSARFAVRAAGTSLRAQPGRTLLTALGIAAAGLVLGVALTVAFSLSTGFDRAADRADLPTVVARFDARDPAAVRRTVGALPNLAAASYRFERTGLRLRAPGHATGQGVLQVVPAGRRRGYAIVAGRDVRASDTGGVVIERGLARAWNVGVGDELRVGRLGAMRVVGIAVQPDNVAFPVAKTARVTASSEALLARFGARPGDAFPVDMVALWARDPARADVLISAARQSSFGLTGLRFLTRDGVRTLIGQAAGIVVALLVAFGIVAAGLAGVLLAAGAQSEVQRSLDRIGLTRALGASPRAIVATHAARGALVCAPAAALGLAAGALLARGPAGGVLSSLNELAPSWGALALLLGAVEVAAIALVAACAALPAWRAARRAPAALLRGGGDVVEGRGPGGGGRGGLVALGAQLVAARRARLASIVAVLGAATAVILLLLALASTLEALRDDPATLGKKYQLTARLPAGDADAVAALPGVTAAAQRVSIPAVSASLLGSPLTVVAYPGDHTRFEAPPLAAGRRVRGPGEAEVGVGLADALGLRVGSTLAIQPQAPHEARFRVVGIVRALQDEGRVAYVQPDRLDAAGAELSGPVVLRLARGANRARIAAGLRALGATADPVRGATGDSGALLGVLASLLRVVALSVALVCLHALVSALALTARERRGAVATLRAVGADGRALRRLLGGAAAAVALPALVVAVLLEALVLAPLVARLASGYADLPLGASAAQVAAVGAALLALAGLAAALTARRLAREPVVAGLREEA